MARYGKKSQDKVEKAMHERKHGTLKSGRSGKKVTSKKQAIAIGLSEARREGGKVPKKSTGAKSRSSAKTQSRGGSKQRTTRAKTGGRKRTSTKQRKAS